MTNLIKAADALAEAVELERKMKLKFDGTPADPIQAVDPQVVSWSEWQKQRVIMHQRLTAYCQARESDDGVNTDDLFNDIENTLYDCIFNSQGEVSGLDDAYDKITARIKAALED